MKSFLGIILVYVSLTAEAQQTAEGNASKFVALTSLLTTVELATESSVELENGIYDRAEYYDTLGFFQFAEKNRVGRENCGYIQAHNLSTGLMISTSIEAFQAEIANFFKTNEQINKEEAAKKLPLITSYLKKLKKVSDECQFPAKSYKSFRDAKKDLVEANTYLQEKVKPILDAMIFDQK